MAAIHWIDNHWDCDSLDVGRLDKAKLLCDAANDLRWNLEEVFVIPSLLLSNEWTRDVLGVLILQNFNCFALLIL